MSRIEENEKLITQLDQISKDNPTGPFQQIIALQVGTIASVLADISKSLAILADKVESEET